MENVVVYISDYHPHRGIIQYLLFLIGKLQFIRFSFSEIPTERTVDFDWPKLGTSHSFIGLREILQKRSFVLSNVENKFNYSESLLVAFYLMNCIQERRITDLDRYGRFTYNSSWQCSSKSIEDNLVQSLINQFVKSIGLQPKSQKTQFFISHDIDFLYGSKSEDLKWAARNWRIGDLIKIIFQEIIRKPHWRNIDRVIKLDSEYEIRATFFWLVNEGRGLQDIPNADYRLQDEMKLVDMVNDNGGYNGLHKSASSDGFAEEMDKSGQPWSINRNHYLKFNTHDHWRAVSEAGIKLDCSLGFSEHYGFRNSYGKPFTPFDIKNNRPYDFVEMPLHVMDATFLHYLKTDPSKIGSTVIDFIEKNKEDCVLSILWHNNYMTEYAYKPFLEAYKEILGYIYENQFECIGPDQIIEEYLLQSAK